MSLDITSFSDVIDRLRVGLRRYELDIRDELVRDGLILRFKVAYEASHKMLKHYLEQTASSPDLYDKMVFADLIRTGNEQGLLRGDWPAWRRYREMRTRTSHTYNANVAIDVAGGIPAFFEEAEFLCGELRRRLE